MSGGAGGRAAATLKYFHFNLKFTVNYLYNYLYLKYINIRQERDGGGEAAGQPPPSSLRRLPRPWPLPYNRTFHPGWALPPSHLKGGGEAARQLPTPAPPPTHPPPHPVAIGTAPHPDVNGWLLHKVPGGILKGPCKIYIILKL